MENLEEIKQKIDESLNNGANPIAAFDADGTLWSNDLGELYFEYLVSNNYLKDLPENPFEHYLYLKNEVKPETAYLWLAQVCKGVPQSKMREWSAICAKDAVGNTIFEGQKELVNYLQEKGVQVYVVTASIKWAVEGGAALLNIPKDNVIGVTVKIDDNDRLTDIQDGPVTFQKGKVTALLEKTNNKVPFFAAGNTMGDLHLINSASHVKVCVNSAPKESKLFDTEAELLAMASKEGWFTRVLTTVK